MLYPCVLSRPDPSFPIHNIMYMHVCYSSRSLKGVLRIKSIFVECGSMFQCLWLPL